MRSSVAVLAFLGLAIQAACNSGSATPAPKPQEPAPKREPTVDLAAAQASYVKLCAPCHAENATGYRADHAPSLVTATFLESATDEFLRRSIIWGRPGTSMGAYGSALGGPLDDTAVNGIVAWLRAKGPKPRTLPTVARGDASRGAPLYKEYCQSCHGDVKTRGEAPHLANVQFLTVASDAFIKHAIVAGRPPTKMLGFGNVMTDPQINDVVAFVRELAAGGPKVSLLAEPTGKEPLVIHPKGADPAWKPREDRFIGVDAVAAALKAGQKMVIIDARPPSEWRRVHLEGAVSIPYHDMKRLDELPKGVWAIAYCACPHHLSGIVVDELKKRGHTRALILDEGINVWHQRGYPVTAAEGVTPAAKDPHSAGGGDHTGHDHGPMPMPPRH